MGSTPFLIVIILSLLVSLILVIRHYRREIAMYENALRLTENVMFEGVMESDPCALRQRLTRGLLENVSLHRREHAAMVVLMLYARGKLDKTVLQDEKILRQEGLFVDVVRDMPRELNLWKDAKAKEGRRAHQQGFDYFRVSDLIAFYDGKETFRQLAGLRD